MKKERWALGALGLLAGYVGYRLGARAFAQVKAAMPPFTRQTLASQHQMVRMFEALWRHPEALALMRSNPVVASPLTDRIVQEIQGALGGARPRAGEWVYTLGGAAHREQGEGATGDVAEVLAFARQYAETRGEPHPDLIDRLSADYGARTARDLTTFVRLATLGVLIGNTADALVSRILGQPSPQTSLGQELRILATFALGILPLLPIMFLRAIINPAGSAA
jgi:hypothetical protein